MWEIGTRVRIIKSNRSTTPVGIIGTVVYIRKDKNNRCIVEFDEPMNGNTIANVLCDCKPNCWWWFDIVPGRIVETDGITIEKIGKRKNNFY